MITELIVLLACTQNAGCSQAQSAYFSTHPEFKQIIKTKSKEIKENIGPTLIYAAPFIAFSINGKATLHINKYVGLQMNNNEQSLILKFSF